MQSAIKKVVGVFTGTPECFSKNCFEWVVETMNTLARAFIVFIWNSLTFDLTITVQLIRSSSFSIKSYHPILLPLRKAEVSGDSINTVKDSNCYKP